MGTGEEVEEGEVEGAAEAEAIWRGGEKSCGTLGSSVHFHQNFTSSTGSGGEQNASFGAASGSASRLKYLLSLTSIFLDERSIIWRTEA
jgi:hypothetical protein